ncbi:MAG: hypothetical protein ACLRZ9_06005 [Eubacterium sp.]
MGDRFETEKSSKDLAFEKERAKLRSEIRKLTDCINDKQKQIDGLNEIVSEKEIVIRQQKEWIDRLLEYTELSEKDMRKIIEREKITSEIVEHFQTMTEIMGRFGI